MDTALLVLCAAVVGGGMVGALIRAWSILSRLYALENQVAVLERTTTSFVKRDAALARPKRNVEDDILEKIQASVPAPAPAKNPWFANLKTASLAKR